MSHFVGGTDPKLSPQTRFHVSACKDDSTSACVRACTRGHVKRYEGRNRKKQISQIEDSPISGCMQMKTNARPSGWLAARPSNERLPAPTRLLLPIWGVGRSVSGKRQHAQQYVYMPGFVRQPASAVHPSWFFRLSV